MNTDARTPVPGTFAPLPGADAPFEHHRSAGHVALELFGITASACVALLLTWQVVVGVVAVGAHDGNDARASHLAIIAGAVLCGYLVADFASGVVHFIFDRFFSVHTPFIGRPFVYPFRLHHSDPKHITRHGFVETNGNNSLATLPFLLVPALLPFDATVGWQVFLVVLVLAGAFGTFLTNQFHKWAHLDRPPPLVAWLQERHLILPRSHHQLHHAWPYDTQYCITTGWLNPLLGRLRFWRLLEWLGTRVVRLRLYTEATPWEHVPGSPAWEERRRMGRTLD